MIKNIFALLSIVATLTACNGASKTNATYDESNQLQSEAALEKMDLFDQTSASDVDNSKNYCSSEVSVYNQSGVVISVSSDWQSANREIPNVDLALVNQSRRLLFTTRSEKLTGTVDDYVNAKIQQFINVGISNAISTRSNVNGVNYYQISAPGSNFNNWQWISPTNGNVVVLSCGSPKGTEPDYDSCLDLIESTQQL